MWALTRTNSVEPVDWNLLVMLSMIRMTATATGAGIGAVVVVVVVVVIGAGAGYREYDVELLLQQSLFHNCEMKMYLLISWNTGCLFVVGYVLG